MQCVDSNLGRAGLGVGWGDLWEEGVPLIDSGGPSAYLYTAAPGRPATDSSPTAAVSPVATGST